MKRTLAATACCVLLAAGCTGGEAGPTSTTTTKVPTTAVTTSSSEAPSTTLPATTTTIVDHRRQVILDYSPTVSDIGALAFLASHPDLRLIAVTLPGTGESFCGPGVAHTRGILTHLGLGDIPVACGPDEPLTGFNAFPTSWRVDSNEMDLPTAPPNEARDAPTLLADLVRAADEPVEIVAVGPLTNLGAALEADPDLGGLIGGITIMGGAVDVPGNVFRNEVGEWNIWVDPTAAEIVVASGAPITLVPLDATNHLPSGRIFWESLDAVATTPAAALVRDVWADNGAWIDNTGGFFYFWDELAAAVLVDETLVIFETIDLVVDDDSRENMGWTRRDPGGSEVRVAMTADRLAFEQLFLDTLAATSADLLYVSATPDEVEYLESLARINAAAAAGLDEIFEAVATERGIDMSSEEGFLELAVLAVPEILAGPWSERIDALAGLEAPPALATEHARYVSALEVFIGSESRIVAALEAGELDALEDLLAPVTESCWALQLSADLRALPIHLGCDL